MKAKTTELLVVTFAGASSRGRSGRRCSGSRGGPFCSLVPLVLLLLLLRRRRQRRRQRRKLSLVLFPPRSPCSRATTPTGSNSPSQVHQRKRRSLSSSREQSLRLMPLRQRPRAPSPLRRRIPPWLRGRPPRRPRLSGRGRGARGLGFRTRRRRQGCAGGCSCERGGGRGRFSFVSGVLKYSFFGFFQWREERKSRRHTFICR